MPSPRTREVEHDITVSAPADAVYRLLADVAHWPRIFPPTIHAERTEGDDTEERIRIWATANGEAKHWTSRRTLDPEALRIDFRQERTADPVAAMGGAWIIEPLGPGTSRIRLLHDYRAVDDDPESLRWIDEAVDRNSRTELASLKANVEAAHAAEDHTLTFSDSVRVTGSAADLYDFIDAADHWPQRLPHVESVRLERQPSGLQDLEMETRAKDGSTHRTRSYRVCVPHERIAYKQTTLPALMSLHTGLWTFDEDTEGVTATSWHTVVINTDNIAAVLGPAATAAEALEYVRGALSANSLATLRHAKDHAEAARR
ncbi:aromatase/cyclase [Streptomyces phyllanthi]|uniref:Cyclase n=1 Tax=Streptomyces phyllanthi TaxID=1803180 RepID=A0A5N8WDC0_9ACTN|nr:aromatase/cyclase [Streptomyces phyllanthi]MPY45319.1 cyclase [Streptomyces phyllanthi]